MKRRDLLLGALIGVVAGVGIDRLGMHMDAMEAAQKTSSTRPPALAPALTPKAARPAPAGKAARPLPDYVRSSVSEQGEDLVLMRVFKALGIPKPTYLDIGSHDPVRFNNTYKLYTNGSRGVLVEPNPFFFEKSKKIRPGDKVLNIGIGITDQKEADYYMIRDRSLLNTFSKKHADKLVKISGPGAIEKVIKMPLVNINTVIKRHFKGAPALVSIDVEGLDLEILRTLDFKRHRPAVFCIETLVFNTNKVRTEVVEFMRTKGYSIRGGTFVNTIFVDDRLLQR